MYKKIDEVTAADLEIGDVFQLGDETYTVKAKEDDGDVIELVVTDSFEDDDFVCLDAYRKIELLMEVDDDAE